MKTAYALIAILGFRTLVALAPAAAEAGPTQTNAAPKPGWTVEDALSWEWASEFKTSPDCRWVVWVKGVPAWFDKYLFQTAQEDPEELKPDAPLALALKLKSAKADGIRYGRMTNGTLVPETVAHGTLVIGRFELTRAQFAAFDHAYKVEPGRENFPANDIPFERAKAYCEWLSQAPGERYRLPNTSESDSLYGKSSGPENTLDYWAGGSVNPDDADKLRRRIAGLGTQAPLLKEVGSLKASNSDAAVFDLGGNVAEWTVTSEGEGRALGGSADLPADQKIRSRRPAPEYIGFRVVKAGR